MKKKFVFDSMESDFSDIIEETIIENTGVNTERVVNTVMKATTAKKIRRFTKRGIIGIAAAVAAAVIISTVSVGAAGGFNQVFGNWFAGQPKYGLFAGSNVSIKSDNLEIDPHSIMGVLSLDLNRKLTLQAADNIPVQFKRELLPFAADSE